MRYGEVLVGRFGSGAEPGCFRFIGPVALPTVVGCKNRTKPVSAKPSLRRQEGTQQQAKGKLVSPGPLLWDGSGIRNSAAETLAGLGFRVFGFRVFGFRA